MSDFKRLTEVELDRMGDEQVVAYIAGARKVGDADAVRDAMAILAWGHHTAIVARVRAKVPTESVEDVAMEVVVSMLNSTFDGKVIGEFRAFMFRIAARRIADFHRKREGDPGQDPLPDENGDDEGVWGRQPYVVDETDAVELRELAGRVLASRSTEHRELIRLYGPELVEGEDLTAAGVVERMAAGGVTVSESNVQQVWHRFKTELEQELDSGEDGGTSHG